mgnify:FL=1
MQPYQIIADIVQIRQSKGISQQELEKRTGIKQPVIARMEKGTTTPRLDTVIKIADALGHELTLKEKEE